MMNVAECKTANLPFFRDNRVRSKRQKNTILVNGSSFIYFLLTDQNSDSNISGLEERKHGAKKTIYS